MNRRYVTIVILRGGGRAEAAVVIVKETRQGWCMMVYDMLEQGRQFEKWQ
jgi:hypothetical protein